jgi:hypothetical protein
LAKVATAEFGIESIFWIFQFGLTLQSARSGWRGAPPGADSCAAFRNGDRLALAASAQTGGATATAPFQGFRRFLEPSSARSAAAVLRGARRDRTGRARAPRAARRPPVGAAFGNERTATIRIAGANRRSNRPTRRRCRGVALARPQRVGQAVAANRATRRLPSIGALVVVVAPGAL